MDKGIFNIRDLLNATRQNIYACLMVYFMTFECAVFYICPSFGMQVQENCFAYENILFEQRWTKKNPQQKILQPAEINLSDLERCLFITAVLEMYTIINGPVPMVNRSEEKLSKGITTGTRLTRYQHQVLSASNLICGTQWFPGDEMKLIYQTAARMKNNRIISICFS